MIINEHDMLCLLNGAHSIFLFEPNYSRKYLPLGLAKISTYLKSKGKKVHYKQYYDGFPCDLVCISSLFTYDYPQLKLAIDEIRIFDPSVKILIGGIGATLLHAKLLTEYESDNNLFVFHGCSPALDEYIPDYNLDWRMSYPWSDFSFLFITRGCPNRCGYCAVWRLEPIDYIISNWKQHILPNKSRVMIHDNNLLSKPKSLVNDIIDYLVDNNKSVIFNNGFDPKYITPDLCDKLSKVKFFEEGLRLSFDRIEEEEYVRTAIINMEKSGINLSNVMAYTIFNFKDTISEAFHRASTCAILGIRPFPQHFIPLSYSNRNSIYVSSNWSLSLIKAFGYYWRSMEYKKTGFLNFLFNTKDFYMFTTQDMQLIDKLRSELNYNILDRVYQ